jgi:CBS domain containing-hemolysin-like protein
MKNKQIASAVVGGIFFAVPYLGLSLGIAPALVIGATAFTASELVLSGIKTKDTLKTTNKDLYKNFNSQTLLPPFHELLDMPLSTYKLQLSLYENALYKIGLKVIGRRLLWLKPNGEYEKINLESFRKEIDNELQKLYN